MKRRTVVLGVVLAAASTGRAQATPGRPAPHGEVPVAVEPSYGEGWRPLAPIASGPRQEHGVAAVGDKVYVIGGIVTDPAGGFPTTGRVEVYDTRHNTWSDAAPLPVAMNHPNVASVGGRIYVLGSLSGGAEWYALRDCFVYDPRADRWTRLPSMPARPARGSAAMGVHGTRSYLAGGMRTLVPGPGGLQETVDHIAS
ncbi:Kelch repeat-containing protein [Streptomyces hygroscopicus]|uniref:Kelch repeat-containing protein n=1 Tax=Streptomyces hygroscopicus TaxID=1912 RepID=UPI00099EFBDC|nr:kelch repeat-containing protein [Streptomyces hygroscopicus]GLV79201.1 hypothetical protein Shyhy02_72010 [Streptomyces hygroscopicus subsp. hygroscopicus]